jgi:rod shape determining protein RodA
MVITAPPQLRNARPVSAGPTTRSMWTRLDWLLLLATGGLLILGTLLVLSATSAHPDLHGYVLKHLVNIGIGIGLAVLVAVTDHRWVRIWSPVVYVTSVVGLAAIFMPGVGTVVNGSRSWIHLGSLSIQPAELAKLAVVVGIALWVAERTEGALAASMHGADVAMALAIAALPAALILAQPDLGTLLILAAVVFGELAVAGAGKRWLILLTLLGIGGAYAAVRVHLLAGYQLDRLLAFIDPSLDPRGAGYNTIQARIAIGNGGLFGQGLFHGSQTQAGFVPEQHTDFIFTVAGEELGLVGAGAIIALFAVVLWRGLRIAARAEDLFGRLAAAGIVCWFGFQAFQNIGMCLGIMPVTGVPLPLVSYGGTSMFASLMAIGLLENIHLRTNHQFGLGVVVRSRLMRSRY